MLLVYWTASLPILTQPSQDPGICPGIWIRSEQLPGGQDPVSELLLGGQDPGTPKTLSQGPISSICNTPNNPKCKLGSHQAKS